jgi:hypothetical protein
MKKCCEGMTTAYCPQCGAKRIDKYSDEVKAVATILHKLFCTWNHTDGCGWYYREDDWEDSTHISYCEKAKTALNLFTCAEIKRCSFIHQTMKDIK